MTFAATSSGDDYGVLLAGIIPHIGSEGTSNHNIFPDRTTGRAPVLGVGAARRSRQGRAFVAYFEAVVKQCGDAKEATNWTMNDLLSTLNERKLDIKTSPLSAESLAELIDEIKATGLNKQRAREVYAVMLDGLSAKQAIDKLGFKVVADESQLLELVKKAITANPKAVADFKKGKVKAADAIKGFVMRETKGMAKTEVVQRILLEELAKT